MSDHGRIEQILMLLAKPGVYEVLHGMSSRGGTATLGHLYSDVRRVLPLLRALSAAGFVIRPDSGSLDLSPHRQTSFHLTAKGQAIAGRIFRLQQSLAPCASHHSGPLRAQ